MDWTIAHLIHVEKRLLGIVRTYSFRPMQEFVPGLEGR